MLGLVFGGFAAFKSGHGNPLLIDFYGWASFHITSVGVGQFSLVSLSLSESRSVAAHRSLPPEVSRRGSTGETVQRSFRMFTACLTMGASQSPAPSSSP
jgi:hypothetical protein